MQEEFTILLWKLYSQDDYYANKIHKLKDK